ncbi:TPA: hypothetical protein ACJ2XG_004270, partial [Klebsiella quasipneumoniae subsp. quasipneumoniae]
NINLPPLSDPRKSQSKYRFKPASYKITPPPGMATSCFSLQDKNHGVIKTKKTSRQFLSYCYAEDE